MKAQDSNSYSGVAQNRGIMGFSAKGLQKWTKFHSLAFIHIIIIIVIAVAFEYFKNASSPFSETQESEYTLYYYYYKALFISS